MIAPFTRQELADLWEFDRRVERGTTERYELNAREEPFFEDYPECRGSGGRCMKKGPDRLPAGRAETAAPHGAAQL